MVGKGAQSQGTAGGQEMKDFFLCKLYFINLSFEQENK